VHPGCSELLVRKVTESHMSRLPPIMAPIYRGSVKYFRKHISASIIDNCEAVLHRKRGTVGVLKPVYRVACVSAWSLQEKVSKYI
jgi:hypothetical protein